MSGKNDTILHNTYIPLKHRRQQTFQGSVCHWHNQYMQLVLTFWMCLEYACVLLTFPVLSLVEVTVYL
jgi:hypothetical protein